jgi:hypothetical protein
MALLDIRPAMSVQVSLRPDGEFVSGGVGEVEAAPAGEGVDVVADRASGIQHPLPRSVEVVDVQHRERKTDV